MGLLGKLKERFDASKSTGRVSSNANIGVDVAPKSQSQKYKEGYGGFESTRIYDKAKREEKDTELFESREEKQARFAKRNAAAKVKLNNAIGKVEGGFTKFERGKKKANKFLGELDNMFGGSSSSKGRRGGGMDFGVNLKYSDLIGNPFGGQKSARTRHKGKSKSSKGLLPIYQGSKIVGYAKGKGRHKRRAKRKNPFDIGF